MKETFTLKEAISVSIGGMVGGGIFAVLGLAVSFFLLILGFKQNAIAE